MWEEVKNIFRLKHNINEDSRASCFSLFLMNFEKKK